jgi:hypothetical protein
VRKSIEPDFTIHRLKGTKRSAYDGPSSLSVRLEELVRFRIQLTLCLAAILAGATPAFADATLFVGTTLSPANRPVWGASGGVSLVIVGFEIEYAKTTDDPGATAPSLTTISGNGYIQTPVEIFHVQPYLTGGVGGFSETLGTHNEKGLASNTGGGARISLAGPLRLRVDYRVFKLGGGALVSPAHRVYVGLNLKF